MHIANNIKFLRKRVGLTQNELAAKIGKVPVTVSDYEKGKTVPPIEIALKLCDIFQITLDDLVNTNLKKEGFPLKAQKDTSPEPGQELLNRLLLQKLEEAAEELKKSNPEAYRRLKLEELIRRGKE